QPMTSAPAVVAPPRSIVRRFIKVILLGGGGNELAPEQLVRICGLAAYGKFSRNFFCRLGFLRLRQLPFRLLGFARAHMLAFQWWGRRNGTASAFFGRGGLISGMYAVKRHRESKLRCQLS
ncbi:MAG: hypothetical protein KKE41_14175, partial [Gammaproteobacteria bacterium]|nr:hypothetical protein [Gammaproteobacteria bacterium]